MRPWWCNMYLSSSVVSMTHKYYYENRGKRQKSRIVRDRSKPLANIITKISLILILSKGSENDTTELLRKIVFIIVNLLSIPSSTIFNDLIEKIKQF